MMAASLAEVALVCCLFAAPADKRATPVEHVSTKPERQDVLGTRAYEPSAAERSYFEKLPPEERTTGGLFDEYDIHAKQGAYVSWFGIVRELAENRETGETRLLVEHKYFDGLTDLHIQVVSFNGDGDFQVVLRGADHKLEPLTLVRVYGKVAKEEKQGELPLLEAAFVRNWRWGAFTFIGAMGKQHGSEKWRKLNTVDLDEIYDPYPDDAYYERRLGKRPARRNP